MLRRFVLLLSLFSALPFLAGPIRPGHAGSPESEDAVYVYDAFRGARNCVEVAARVKQLPLRRTIILSIEQGREFLLDRPGGEALLECVLDSLRASSQTAKALFLQDPSLLRRRVEAVRRAALLGRFVARHPGKLAGAQVDVEPYATEDWSCGNNEERGALMHSLAELLRQVREQLAGLPLSLAAGWWYPALGKEIPEASPAALFDALDEIYLMAYGDPGGPVVGGSAARVLDRIGAPEFFTAPGRVHVALATYEFHSQEQLQAELETIRRRLAAQPRFGGTAVFHAGGLFDAPLVRIVSGTTTDAAGRGLAGVRVEADGMRGTSNRCGQFSLRGLAPRTQLVLRKPGFRARRLPVELPEPGLPRDLGKVVMERSR